MSNRPSDNNYMPPTYLHCFKYHLSRTGRGDVKERDKKMLQYIRCLQQSRNKNVIFSVFRAILPGIRFYSRNR